MKIKGCLLWLTTLMILITQGCGDDGSERAENAATPELTWGQPQILEPFQGYSFDPQFARDSKGNSIVVWHQNVDSENYNIWAVHDLLWRGWQPPLRLGVAEFNARTPQITFDASGNAIAVWCQDAGSDTHVWASKYSPRAGWGIPEIIAPTVGGRSFTPRKAWTRLAMR